MNDEIKSDRIFDVCFGYWKSKVLMTAVDLDLFTHLNGKRLSLEQLASTLNVKSIRGLEDIVDCLVSMSFLNKIGNGVYIFSFFSFFFIFRIENKT